VAARDGEVSARGTALPVEGTSIVLPDAEGVLTAVARIGYSLEIALADLVDNSIDANAGKVLIRFFRTRQRLISLAVVDDGDGMTENRLEKAMGFGSSTGRGDENLGKYGMGLKAASFSQSRSVTVLTARRGVVSGRRWTADNIRSGWICDHIARDAAAQHLDQDWGQVKLDASGTLVHWDELDAFRVAKNRADGVLEDLFRRISLHLGLTFHRFIESKRITIYLDAVNEETRQEGPQRPIQPVNPFGYQESGRRNYPRTFRCDIPRLGRLDLEGHIWPRRSRLPGYTLGGGRVSQRQGFYFYRNARLIQAGGWNGWRDDAEPHASLARVRVNLPAKYDHAFGLNVQKSAVSVPEGFLEALPSAASDATSFSQYMRDAIDTYRRTGQGTSTGPPPLVPDRGLGTRLAAKVRLELAGSLGKHTRGVRFDWRRLSDDQFFDLDRERDTIILNSQYRSAVLFGTRGGAADAPLTKSLLFLLVSDELDRQRSSEGSREWMAKCQSVLVEAARVQMRHAQSL
jgi:hypothetical protein